MMADCTRILASASLCLAVGAAAIAQSPKPAGSTPAGNVNAATNVTNPEEEAQDRGWPREFVTQDHVVRVYAPQVDEWPNFDRISFRAAISVSPKGSENRAYGIVRMSADTKISVEDRLVVLTNRKVEELTFPNVEDAEAERLKSIVRAAAPPERPQTVSLDRLVAEMDPAKVDIRKVDVNIAPPKIYSSEKPAIMVIFMGKSRFKPVPDSDLLFAINTNWDIFLEPASKKYYLLNDKSWLVTDDLDKGAWTAASSLPDSLSKLPPDDNWNDVREAIPGEHAKELPVVYVSHEPAELIITAGKPEMEPIPGTGLMLVANTDSHLFYNAPEKQFYLLAAGRWFKSAAVAGPWAAASASLPEDFKKIPEDSDAADVLAAVPGTAAANEAMILASIPQKATINRNEVKLEVSYDGEPKFQPIESTTVQYAANTPFSVFLVDGKYYCCNNAVWFEAPAPTGVWTVCVNVPKAIYTIPPTSPKYNVTYVTVYESTPTTVVTGYSSGYSGETVAATGAVMFGLGILVGAALDNDDCCWSYRYPSCYFSYGCGAAWSGGHGGYVCGVSHYGPYGGAGRAAAYNPATGVYSRAGYVHGPRGAAGYRTAYNPSTGVAAGRAGGATPYGSWGRSAVTNGDEWVRGGHKSTARGTVGAIQGSEGRAAVTAQGRFGNGATVARDKDGDYYASKDGNVYKKGDDGWQQTRNSPSGTRAAPAGARSEPTNRAVAPATRQAPPDVQQKAKSRDRGDRNATRATQAKSRGAQRAAPSRGGGRSR